MKSCRAEALCSSLQARVICDVSPGGGWCCCLHAGVVGVTPGGVAVRCRSAHCDHVRRQQQ